LTLNYKKCHFTVKRGIFLGHIIFGDGIEVKKAKIDLIVIFPSHLCQKDVRPFFGHAGFYCRCTKDFIKFAKLLSNLLAKDVPFTSLMSVRRHLLS